MNILKRLLRRGWVNNANDRELANWLELGSVVRGLSHIGPTILSAYINEIQLLTPEKLRRVRQLRGLTARARRLPR